MAAEPIPIQTEKPSLVSKLARIVSEIDHVEKKGRNEFQRYAYVKAADLANVVRKKLAAANVFMLSDVVKRETASHPAKDGGTWLFENIEVKYTFLDGDSDQTLAFTMPGTGADKGDKAIYKAITGSLKYALRNAFLVPDEKADPEGDETIDKEQAKEASRAVAERKIAEGKERAKAQPKPAQKPPESTGDPFDEAMASVQPENLDAEPAGVLVKDVVPAKAPNGKPYMKVTLDSGLVLGCWHKSLFEWLPFAKGKLCDFVITTNKGYSNIGGIRKIGRREFLDGVPALDRDEDPKKLEF